MTIGRIHDSRLVRLVDELCQLSGETEWVEFKRNYHSAQRIGEYISALANAACLKYSRSALLAYSRQVTKPNPQSECACHAKRDTFPSGVYTV